MGDNAGNWIGFMQWIMNNPEKGALFLVLLAGAWRWLLELRKAGKEDAQHESFTELLLRENKELRTELRKAHQHKADDNPDGDSA